MSEQLRLQGIVAASGASLAVIILACVLAGSAAARVGAYLADLMGDARSRHTSEHLEHGGLLLWVRTWNDDENRAISILRSTAALMSTFTARGRLYSGAE